MRVCIMDQDNTATTGKASSILQNKDSDLVHPHLQTPSCCTEESNIFIPSDHKISGLKNRFALNEREFQAEQTTDDLEEIRINSKNPPSPSTTSLPTLFTKRRTPPIDRPRPIIVKFEHYKQKRRRSMTEADSGLSDQYQHITSSPISRIDFFLISSLDKIYYQWLLVITAVTFSLHKVNTRWSFNTSQLQLQYGKQQKAVLRGINISFSVLKQKKERTRSWKSNNTISFTQGIQERKPRTNDFKKTEFLRCRLRRE